MGFASGKMNNKILLLVLSVFFWQGCSSHIIRGPAGPAPEIIEEEYIPDTIAAGTPKGKVYEVLGKPSFEYTEDRIAVYRLLLENGSIRNLGTEYIITAPTNKLIGYRYSLILLFDDKWNLKKKKVIPER
jgi:hypothetical protein